MVHGMDECLRTSKLINQSDDRLGNIEYQTTNFLDFVISPSPVAKSYAKWIIFTRKAKRRSLILIFYINIFVNYSYEIEENVSPPFSKVFPFH